MTTYLQPPTDWDTSGATDLSRPLADWFATVPDGSVVDFGATPSLRLDEGLTLRRRRGLEVLDLRHHVTRDGALGNYRADGTWMPDDRSHRPHLELIRCEDVHLVRPAVTGINAPDPATPGFNQYRVAYEGEHAVEILGCTGVTVTELDATDVCGDNVHVGHALRAGDQPLTPSTRIRVHGGRGAGNGRQGLSLTYCEDVLVDGFQIDGSRRSGMDLEPNTNDGWVRDVKLLNTIIRSNLLAFPSKGKGDVSDVVISNAYLLQSGSPAVFCATPDTFKGRRRNWTIRGLRGRVNASDRAAIELVGVDDVTIEDCELTGIRRAAVLLNRCGGVLDVNDSNDFGGRPVEVRNPLEGADLRGLAAA